MRWWVALPILLAWTLAACDRSPEPTSGQLALKVSGAIRAEDVLSLEEVDSFVLSGRDSSTPQGFMSLYWDGRLFGASIESPTTEASHRGALISLTIEADQTVYDFTTEVDANRQKCVLTIDRADEEALQGSFACHDVVGVVLNEGGVLEEPQENAPVIDVSAAFFATSG